MTNNKKKNNNNNNTNWLSETVVLVQCAEQGESALSTLVPATSLTITNYYIGVDNTCLFVDSVHCDILPLAPLTSNTLIHWAKWFEQHHSSGPPFPLSSSSSSPPPPPPPSRPPYSKIFKFNAAALFWPKPKITDTTTTTTKFDDWLQPSLSLYKDVDLPPFPLIYHGLQELIFLFQEQPPHRSTSLVEVERQSATSPRPIGERQSATNITSSILKKHGHKNATKKRVRIAETNDVHGDDDDDDNFKNTNVAVKFSHRKTQRFRPVAIHNHS